MKKHLLSFILMAASVGTASASEPVLGIVCSYGQEEAFFPLFDSPSVEYVTKDDVQYAVVMVGGEEKLSVALVDGGTLTVTYDSRSLHDHIFAEEWSQDENNHWHVCTGEGECDAQPEAHAYGEVVTETAYYTCSVCQYENATREAAYNQAVAEAVVAKIDAIGTVEYTDDCKALIDAAREAYDAQNDDQKALITDEEYKVLTDAEFTYEGYIRPVSTIAVTEGDVEVDFHGRFNVFASQFMQEMGVLSVTPVKGNWHMNDAATDDDDVEISSNIIAMNSFTFNFADYNLADGEWDITLPKGFFVYLNDDYDFEETSKDVANQAKARERLYNAVRRAALHSEKVCQVEEITVSVSVKNNAVTAINGISTSAEGAAYDLSGRKLNTRNAKGVVITKGKKKIVK